MIIFLAMDSLIEALSPYQEIFASSEIRNLKIILWCFFGLLILFGIFYFFAGRKNTKKLQPVKSLAKTDYELELRKIHSFHIQGNLFREGCYKISATLKSFLETVYNKDIEEMTVFEIERNLNDNSAREIMRQLSIYQFRKIETSKSDFEKIYQRAITLIQDRKRFLSK